jgi:hypothetical protein
MALLEAVEDLTLALGVDELQALGLCLALLLGELEVRDALLPLPPLDEGLAGDELRPAQRQTGGAGLGPRLDERLSGAVDLGAAAGYGRKLTREALLGLALDLLAQGTDGLQFEGEGTHQPSLSSTLLEPS